MIVTHHEVNLSSCQFCALKPLFSERAHLLLSAELVH
jgi:hypothetical protein